MISAKNKQGFTIVELLIVVVVIAILAAITIVAYNGIQNRAKQSAARSATSQAAKKILLYAVERGDVYPDTLQDASVSDSGQTTYQYTVNNLASPRVFCVTATVQNFSYYQSSTQPNPTAGACSGHGLNGLPPNLAVNPSFDTDAAAFTVRSNLLSNPSLETDISGWGVVNGGTGSAISGSTAQAQSGSRSLLYAYGDNAIQDSGPSTSFAATAGTTYTVSAWVYAPVSTGTGLRMAVYGAAIGGNTERGATTATVGSWVRVSYTVTATATGSLSLIIGKAGSVNDNGKLLYVDSAIVEIAPSLSYYFSGATSPTSDFTYGWNGTQNLSTSNERALGIANYSANGSGSVRLRSSERAASGTYSARVLMTNTATNAGLYQTMTLRPGTYTFISKVWNEAGLGGLTSITAQGTGVSTAVVSGYISSTSAQNQWVELRRLVTVPATTTVNFFVYMPTPSTVMGSSFWADDFAVVLGTCTDAACY